MRFLFIIACFLMACTAKNGQNNVEQNPAMQHTKEALPASLPLVEEKKVAQPKIDYPEPEYKETIKTTPIAEEKIKISEKQEVPVIEQPPKKIPKPFKSINSPKPWSTNQKNYISKTTEHYEKSTKPPDNPPDQALPGKKLPLTRFLRADGELVDLKDYEGKKNVLLVILRGFAGSICLVCSSQTLALSKMASSFQEKETEILLMYPGVGETVPEFLEALEKLQPGYEPPFPVVMDVDLEFIKTMNLEASLARPTSIIMDKKGIVRYAYIGKSVTDRPTVQILLQELEKIQ
ncbi:MAG: redoxin domain-containing protein [Candidatus Brocadiae bacterium]|nr:redoxin domain-containing protein [Candidatus Brocadiia bacterium]